MKKLTKIKLQEAKVLTSSQMKNITGGMVSGTACDEEKSKNKEWCSIFDGTIAKSGSCAFNSKGEPFCNI